MTLRDDLLPALNDARAICDEFGLRQNAVDVIVRTWASGEIGVPETQIAGVDYVDQKIRLVPNPKVRRLTQREIASSGGRYEDADLIVGPMTPAFAGGGNSTAQLDPLELQPGVELIYVLSGPNAGEHAAIDVRRDRPMRYEVVVRRTRRTPG
jgi:hypothetical protein